jgi:IS6 family transposase
MASTNFEEVKRVSVDLSSRGLPHIVTPKFTEPLLKEKREIGALLTSYVDKSGLVRNRLNRMTARRQAEGSVASLVRQARSGRSRGRATRRQAARVRQDRAFKGRQFTAEVILWAVRWYPMFPISNRDLELMLLDRGVEVDHTTIFRWIQVYAVELEKRIRPHLRMSNGSRRVDESYVKVKGRWMYLYRAVDSRGQTIDFLLSAKRDAEAAKRFFRKVLAQPHTVNPRTITVDKNAAYPKAVTDMKKDGELWRPSRLRQIKYLNSIVEQDHRRVKRLTGPGLGFGGFWTARRTLAGSEAMAMIRKGQVRNIGGSDIRAQAKFIAGLFQVAA